MDPVVTREVRTNPPLRAPIEALELSPARNRARRATFLAPSRANLGVNAAYRDRNAGSANNRTKPTEDRTAGTYGGRGGRGGQGRGGRGGPRLNDRHSRAVVG